MPELSLFWLALVFLVTFLTKTYGVIVGGASFVLQPFLIAIGVPPHMAVAHDIAGTNATTVAGLHIFLRSGHIHTTIARYALPGVTLGPLLGVALLNWMPAATIETVIACVSIIGALYLMLHGKNTIGLEPRAMPRYWRSITLAYGLIFGIYCGFSGAGGGIASMYVLIAVLGLTMTRAIATKRIIHAMPFIIATIGYLWHGWLVPGLFSAVFLGCLAGGYAGAYLTMRLNDQLLKYVFLTAAIIIAGLILAR